MWTYRFSSTMKLCLKVTNDVVIDLESLFVRCRSTSCNIEGWADYCVYLKCAKFSHRAQRNISALEKEVQLMDQRVKDLLHLKEDIRVKVFSTVL